MKNGRCDKAEEKSSCGDTEAGWGCVSENLVSNFLQ